jgi:hypothetical protein
MLAGVATVPTIVPGPGEIGYFGLRPFNATATFPNEHIGANPVRGDSANGSLNNTNQAPWAFNKSAGGNIWRFEVRYGDVASNDVAAGNTNKNRCEVTLQDDSTPTSHANRYPQFTNLWCAHSFMIPVGCTIAALTQFSTCVLTQLFASEDEGEVGRSPPFALRLQPGTSNFKVMKRFDTSPISGPTPPEYILYEGPLTLGVWHTVVFMVNFDWNLDGSGACDFWLDGVQIVNYRGQIGYNDAQGPICKSGLYKSPRNPADPPIIKYLANWEFGTDDLSARILNPLPVIS